MNTNGTGLWLLGVAAALGAAGSRAAVKETQTRTFQVHPVGYVRTIGEKTAIEIEEAYRDALLGLDGFSHVHVLWWFHQNDTPEKRRILRVHPRGNTENPLTGVFATRAPMRPNPIALTVCKIAAIEGCRIYVEGMDAFDGSPVLDLKPYVPTDRIAELRVPEWAKKSRPAAKQSK